MWSGDSGPNFFTLSWVLASGKNKNDCSGVLFLLICGCCGWKKMQGLLKIGDYLLCLGIEFWHLSELRHTSIAGISLWLCCKRIWFLFLYPLSFFFFFSLFRRIFCLLQCAFYVCYLIRLFFSLKGILGNCYSLFKAIT